MELVIDTNIVFSAIVKNSVSRFLLLNPNLILYSPEGLISEIEEHKEEIREKSTQFMEKLFKYLLLILLAIKMLELVLPMDLKDRMERFPEVNWSSIVRKAIEERLEKLAFLKYFASESEITEEESIILGRELNKKLADWYRE